MLRGASAAPAQAAGVQVYFAGHDHNLEHIHPAGGALPHYVISGGGSKCERPFIDRRDSLFQWQSSGTHPCAPCPAPVLAWAACFCCMVAYTAQDAPLLSCGMPLRSSRNSRVLKNC